jgi:copper resistance protein D
MSPDIVSVVVRGLSFVLLFQAIGAAVFSMLFGSMISTTHLLQRIVRAAAIAGAFMVAVHLILEATRMTGDFSGLSNWSMQRRVLWSASAASHGLQLLGLMIVSTSTAADVRHRNGIAILGCAFAIGAFLLVGHTSVNRWRIALAPLLALHLFIVAFWFGSLLPLCIVVRNEAITTATSVLQRFSSLATWLVPLIAIAGLVMMYLIADGLPSIHEPYGQLILAKIGGFVALLLLAALNKWLLTPALTSAIIQSRIALQRSMIMEWLLLFAVLVATATMTTLFSPNE